MTQDYNVTSLRSRLPSVPWSTRTCWIGTDRCTES